jgi:hypothetical protein
LTPWRLRLTSLGGCSPASYVFLSLGVGGRAAVGVGVDDQDRTAGRSRLEREGDEGGRASCELIGHKPCPRLRPEARTASKGSSEGRWLAEVAAPLGLPLPALGALAVAALAGAFDLGRGPLQAGPDLVGL